MHWYDILPRDDNTVMSKCGGRRGDREVRLTRPLGAAMVFDFEVSFLDDVADQHRLCCKNRYCGKVLFFSIFVNG